MVSSLTIHIEGPSSRCAHSVKPSQLLLAIILAHKRVEITTLNSHPEAATLARQAWSIRGVSGQPSELPCDLNPRTQGDRPKLILWYRKGQRKPIFSYDGRSSTLKSEVHHGRGHMNISRVSAALSLNSVTAADAGVYECRVDFFGSPTHTSVVNLTVIEPVRHVEVHDSRSGPIRSGTLGPYKEGDNVTLYCIAKNAKPTPNVTWWKDDGMLDSSWRNDGVRLLRNSLTITNLTREWHNATLTCKAVNTHLAEPAVTTVLIEMYLLPTRVTITGSPTAKVGEQLRLRCLSEGSRPAAHISWTIGGVNIQAEKENTHYGSATSSWLKRNVSRSDDKLIVTCNATNPAIGPSTSITNSTVLDIQYPPIVNASLGDVFRSSVLKEGNDVFLSCTVTANPPVSSITWYHEDKRLVGNLSEGIILTGESLVLQKVERKRVGSYRCSASNSLASVTSSPVELRIQYKPQCVTSPTTFFIYDKPINVTCTVSSYPPVDKIQWRWNNSQDIIRTRPSTAAPNHATAQLLVQPSKTNEDRELSCWGVNEEGRQPTPCRFTIKVAKMPAPLSSCRLANITATSLSLTCERPTAPTAGTTLYRAEVYLHNNTLFANVTSHSPSFNVSRLDAGTSYQIKVYVSHGPITSQPVVVSAYTSRVLIDRDPEPTDSSSPVGGIVGGIVVVIVVVIWVVWVRHYRRKRRSRKISKESTAQPPPDESNPDVVPNIAAINSSSIDLIHSSALLLASEEETYDLLATGERKATPSVYNILGSPRQENIQLQPFTYKESYSPLLLQGASKDSEDLAHGVRADVYCPVDQLLQAEESVV
ncbi:neural cell adhesion molecule 2-like [Oratosquilla oratoria]|uniref:neural cell adhesion molecule 2-like n=1 Tax=Oratosquilla oratoria TaxID=337810 RepID=UPI003F763693